MASSAYSYETDQYETVGIELKDATYPLNRLIQSEIEDVVELWQGRERNDTELAFDIASRFSRRQLEVWGIDSPHVESYSSGHNSIYGNVSPFVALIQYSKGLAPTVSINEVHLGLDKLTHFFGVGALYLHVAKQFESKKKGERAAIEFGMRVERTYWGSMTTGVYSNADMVANYEGFRFLRGLFTDKTVPEKPALLVWDEGGPSMQRAFDIRDYVNDYWNEVFNPNSFSATISAQIIQSLEALCGEESEKRQMEAYISPNDKELSQYYRDKGVRADRVDYLLPKICGDFHGLDPQEKERHRQDYREKPSKIRTLPINVLGIRAELKKIEQTISSRLCRKQVIMAAEEHDLILKTYDSLSPAVWELMKTEMEADDVENRLASGLKVASNKISIQDESKITGNDVLRHQCYMLDVPDPENIVRNGFMLKICLCLEKKSDGSWLKKKQYVVSFEDAIQLYFQGIDPIMLNFLDARFTHYSSDTLGYFSWDQRVGYIYRTISPLCRWF